MALQVVSVTPPAAGTDWSFTVPGQWLPFLYGVTATLVTASAVTGFPDETGNGNTAVLSVGSSGFTIGAQGPYAGGANNYAVAHPNLETGINQALGVTANMSIVGPANFTLEAWADINDIVVVGCDIMGLTNSALSGEFTAMSVKGVAGDPFTGRHSLNNAGTFDVAAWASRNAWHLLAITYDGANWRFYRDGTLVQTTGGFAPTLVGNVFRCHVAGDRFFGVPFGSVGATAFYPVALAGANLAAHAAANGSWTAYRAAVLADTPTALWGLNTIPSGPSRIATLKITDGTRTVAQFPASFAAATSDSFIWSWQVLGPGAQSSTDGKVNSVPIPELTVNAGYVISASTLDLAGTDRWGPITLWFDDGTGPSDGGAGGMGDWPYLNALLVPEYHGGRG
jgi:hypothetical protein